MTFVIIGLLAFIATILTPLAPVLLAGSTLIGALIGLQFLLGTSQAPIFPVASGIIESWFPAPLWPVAQGLVPMGVGLGAAVTAPLVAWLMSSLGWQQALIWTTLPSLALVALWAWYGRNTPAEHPAITQAELDEMDGQQMEQPTPLSWARARSLLRNREVLALTFSYMCMNYIYYLLGNWSFLYLVQQRHFSLLEGGWLAAVPPLAAALGAGIGGKLAADWSRRHGLRWGLHLLPLMALPVAGALLLLALNASNPYLAVAALALSFTSVELTEGSFWAAIMNVARTDTMGATGILNTGGNLGGLIATPIVASLSGHQHWNTTLALGCAFAVVSALTWLLVDPTRRFVADASASEPYATASTT
jgi:ACS family glucarate transporter-like MFS transporter